MPEFYWGWSELATPLWGTLAMAGMVSWGWGFRSVIDWAEHYDERHGPKDN